MLITDFPSDFRLGCIGFYDNLIFDLQLQSNERWVVVALIKEIIQNRLSSTKEFTIKTIDVIKTPVRSPQEVEHCSHCYGYFTANRGHECTVEHSKIRILGFDKYLICHGCGIFLDDRRQMFNHLVTHGRDLCRKLGYPYDLLLKTVDERKFRGELELTDQKIRA